MLYAVAKRMYQNVVALHTTNSMLNKNADLTQSFIGSLVLIAQLRVRILLTLARFLRRDVDLITTVIRSNAEIASIDPNIEVRKPVQLRRELLFQHAVIVMVTTKGPPKKNDKLVRQGHDRVFQRMLFFPL